jgi:hypothetical protein
MCAIQGTNTILMCNYSITLFLYILKYFVRSSDVLLKIYIYIYIYIPLPIYNSDDVIMSRENRNFHLRLFVKGGALQSGIRAIRSEDR